MGAAKFFVLLLRYMKRLEDGEVGMKDTWWEQGASQSFSGAPELAPGICAHFNGYFISPPCVEHSWCWRAGISLAQRRLKSPQPFSVPRWARKPTARGMEA